MTETSRVTGRRDADERYTRSNRVNQVLAWVGIVAGVVFVVAVVFFSGFIIGRSSSGHYYGGHHPYLHYGQLDPTMRPGQLAPGGMMGPQTSTTAPRP
ncbi:MAG: hypothetical protein ACXVGO_14425 [Mycobacterium sp.]